MVMGKVTFDIRHTTTATGTSSSSLVGLLPEGGTLRAVSVNPALSSSPPLQVRLSLEVSRSDGSTLAAIVLRNGWMRGSVFSQDGALTWTGEIPIRRGQRSSVSARVRNDTGAAVSWDLTWIVEGP